MPTLQFFLNFMEFHHQPTSALFCLRKIAKYRAKINTQAVIFDRHNCLAVF